MARRVNLKGLRVNAGYTAVQVAKIMEVSLPTVYAWENDRRTPSVVTVIKLCRLYKCDIEDVDFESMIASDEARKTK